METLSKVICGDRMGNHGNNWGNKQHVMERPRTALRSELGIRPNRDVLKPKHPSDPRFSMSHMHDAHRHPASSEIAHDIHFASSGTCGIVDLGASQTVIGSQQVAELLQGLPAKIRSRAHVHDAIWCLGLGITKVKLKFQASIF